MVHMVILAARWQLVSTSNVGRVVDKCHNVFDQVELTWVIAYKASEEQIEERLWLLVGRGGYLLTTLVLNIETHHHELD